MKKILLIITVLSIGLSACSDNKQNENQVNTSTSSTSSTGVIEGLTGTGESLSGKVGTGISSTGVVQSLTGTGAAPVTQTVNYMNGDEKYKGYLAKPAEGGPYPALILIHEWWGLNDNIKKLSEDFAKQGYVVLAVDLYGKDATKDREEAQKMATEVRNNMTGAFQNLESAVSYLKMQSNVDGSKIGSVGWCFGGGWAYQMAKNNLGSKVSVMYYGQFNPEDDLSMMKSDILGHFGEKDTSITIDSVKEFQAKLQTQSGVHEVYIYPNAGHGFANEDGEAYNKEAADLAWTRTIDFLSRNLKR